MIRTVLKSEEKQKPNVSVNYHFYEAWKTLLQEARNHENIDVGPDAQFISVKLNYENEVITINCFDPSQEQKD